MSELKLGCKVVCPVTDKDGEPAHEIGFLRDINSRWARVEVSSGIVRVGKTKIEPFEEPVAEDEKPVRKTDRSHLVKCRTASGRKSVSNGDAVADFLSGQTLDFAYKATALALDLKSDKGMRAEYAHLNNGQQRMCLGARMRKAVKVGGDKCWERIYKGLL